MIPTTPAAVFMRSSLPYAAASTARRKPESRASSHSHGQKARFKAMSCMRTTMSAVHTTEPSGTGSEALIPRGRRGVVSAPRRTRSVTLMSPHASNSPRCFNLARKPM